MTVTVIGDNTGDDFSGTEDNYIWQSNPTLNQGTSNNLAVRLQTADQINGLLSFSGLSNISPSSTVSSATVGIYKTQGVGTGTSTARFQRLLRNWNETQSTWNIWSTGNNWTTSGGLSDGNDRSATTTCDLAVDVTSADNYKTVSSAQLAADVEDFIDGTSSNYGWILEQIDNTDSYITYRASDYTDGQRPYLSVTHAAAGGPTIPIIAYHHNHNIGSHL